MNDSDGSIENRTRSCSAIWIPAWHELDQTLSVGLRQKFCFFEHVPDHLAGQVAKDQMLFFNDSDPDQDCDIRFARIESMDHAALGPLLRVDTWGLDYILYPADGEEVVVDAEEDPGRIQLGWASTVDDWTIRVRLVEISEPLAGTA